MLELVFRVNIKMYTVWFKNYQMQILQNLTIINLN